MGLYAGRTLKGLAASLKCGRASWAWSSNYCRCLTFLTVHSTVHSFIDSWLYLVYEVDSDNFEILTIIFDSNLSNNSYFTAILYQTNNYWALSASASVHPRRRRRGLDLVWYQNKIFLLLRRNSPYFRVHCHNSTLGKLVVKKPILSTYKWQLGHCLTSWGILTALSFCSSAKDK